MIFPAGLAAGAAIGVLTALIEHSRIELGRFALYGNGALVIPAIGTTLTLYAGWTPLVRERAGRTRVGAMVLFAAGLHLGIGVWAPVDAVVFPQAAGPRLVDVLPGLLLQGLIFVDLPAIVAALVIWIYAKIPVNAATLAAGYVVGMPFALVFGIVTSGTLAGTGVVHGSRAGSPRRRIGVGVLVFALTLVAGFALPAVLFGPGPQQPPP